MQLIVCCHFRPQGNWKMANHRHTSHHETIVVVKGTLEAKLQGQVLTAQRGDVLLYPQHSWHEERAVGDEQLETYFFSWTAESPRQLPLIGCDREGRILGAVRWIHETFPPQCEADRMLHDALLQAIVHEYGASISPRDSGPVSAARAHVRRNLNRKIALGDLARAAGLSTFRFAHLFREQTNESPMSCVRRMRVEAARSLLQSTPLPLKAIAEQVGFCDEYLLSRTFKKLTGVTCGAMRRYRQRLPLLR